LEETVDVGVADMSDNGLPFVVWMPGILTGFGKLQEVMNAA